MKTRSAKIIAVLSVFVLSVLLFTGAAFAHGNGPGTSVPNGDGPAVQAPDGNWLQQMQEWMGPEAWGQMIQYMTQVHGGEFTGRMLQWMNETGGCHGNGGGYPGMMGRSW